MGLLSKHWVDVLEASPMPNLTLGHVNGAELYVLIDVEVGVIIKCDGHIAPADLCAS